MHLIQEAKPILEVNKLNIQLNEQKILTDLSFQLNAGETVAIVGESGSGKSLACLSLLGLQDRALDLSGEIIFQNEDLRLKHEDQLRLIRGNKIAMIFQEPMTALNPLHTIEKIISEPLWSKGLKRKDIRKKIEEVLCDVGLGNSSDILKRYPHQLSGGQRQRVMIATALISEPEILIADEPTTALDVSLQKQILNLIKDQAHQKDMALVLVSHDLRLVQQYADQVLVLSKGVTVEQGDVSQIFLQPRHELTRLLLNQQFDSISPISEQAKELLNTEHLRVRYPPKLNFLNVFKTQFIAVEDLSFQLKQGESLGIVGESGSGKTSAALALARLIESTGTIELNCINLNHLSDKQLRAHRKDFQFVFQDPFSSLNPRMDVLSLLTEGLRLKKLRNSEKLNLAIQALEEVNLTKEFLDRYPHQMSGGQRQRVSLARALILKPQLLILDEPTSALDRNTQIKLVKLLQDIQQRTGISYIFISHDLKIVKALCHRVMVMKDAKVLEIQETERLFRAPIHAYTQHLIQNSL